MAGVRLVVNLHAKPGEAEHYLAATAPHFAEVSATEAGCLQYELFRSVTDPDNLAVLEWWQDRAAFDAHWDREKARGLPAGTEHLGHPRDRHVGRDTTEIYWTQQGYRFDQDADMWVPR